METDGRLARLTQLKLRLDARPDQATRAELLKERDQITAELLGELGELHHQHRQAWIEYNEALLRRDAKVRELMRAKVSPSAVAYAIDSDRTWPYTVAGTYHDRLAKWRAMHP